MALCLNLYPFESFCRSICGQAASLCHRQCFEGTNGIEHVLFVLQWYRNLTYYQIYQAFLSSLFLWSATHCHQSLLFLHKWCTRGIFLNLRHQDWEETWNLQTVVHRHLLLFCQHWTKHNSDFNCQNRCRSRELISIGLVLHPLIQYFPR